jgi:hypothetical protein
MNTVGNDDNGFACGVDVDGDEHRGVILASSMSMYNTTT